MQDASEMMFYPIEYTTSSDIVTFVVEVPPHGVASITFPIIS